MRIPAALILSLAVLQGCDSADEEAARKHNLCEIGTMCDSAAPPPVMLLGSTRPDRIGDRLGASLKKDISGRIWGYELGPYRQQPWVDGQGRKRSPLRFYFVSAAPDTSIGALWVVYDHLAGEEAKTQMLMANINRNLVNFVTDAPRRGQFTPYRIAVIDKRTATGPTFVSGYPQLPYVRHEYDSRYVRRDWEGAITSSCGGGPLTEVPPEWLTERARDCAELRDRHKWYNRVGRRLKGVLGSLR